MYFEAEIKGTQYKIEVKETKTHWHISLTADKKEKEQFVLSKDDYTKFDDTISLLFMGKHYMLDCLESGEGYMIYTGNSYRSITIHNDESLLHKSLKMGAQVSAADSLTAGMPGKIVKILV